MSGDIRQVKRNPRTDIQRRVKYRVRQRKGRIEEGSEEGSDRGRVRQRKGRIEEGSDEGSGRGRVRQIEEGSGRERVRQRKGQAEEGFRRRKCLTYFNTAVL